VLFQDLMHMVRNDGESNQLIWTTSAGGLNWDSDQTIYAEFRGKRSPFSREPDHRIGSVKMVIAII
jgi:hypothetical protein